MYATTRGFLHAEHKTDRDDITKGDRQRGGGGRGWKEEEEEEKKQRRQYGDDDDKMRRGKKQRGRRSGGRNVENVRPDRDTEKRVAASEEEEADLP